MAARWVIRTAGVLYAVGVALFAVAVYADLPGPLGAFGDSTAWWPIAVTLGAGLSAFGTWRWANRRNVRPFAVVLLALLIATVLVLASASYSRCPEPGLSTFWSVVSRVIGLLTNNYAIDMFKAPACDVGGVPLALQFARLAQLIVLLVAATSAVTALLRTQVDRLVVRWSREVSLAIGVDEESIRLLPSLAASAPRLSTLAVIADDPLAPWVVAARQSGWRVIIGEADDAAMLRRLLILRRGRHTLRYLAVLSKQSVSSVKQFNLVRSVLSGHEHDTVRVLLRIDDPWQAEHWRRQQSLGAHQGWLIDTVSRTEETARLIVDDAVSRGRTEFVIAGESDLAYAILPELAQRAREQELSPEPATLSVTLLGPRAKTIWAEHEAASTRFHMASQLRIGTQRESDVVAVLAASPETAARAAVVLTDEPNAGDQRVAARLAATYADLPLYVAYAGVHGVEPEPLIGELHAYGTALDVGDSGAVGRWDRLARAVHQVYTRTYPDPDNPTRRSWSQLDAFYREANVRQVQTVLASMTSVGRSWSPSGRPGSAPSEAQLTRMAEIEHESWRAFLRRNRWEYAAERDRVRKRHPDLVPWAELSAESREKTRAGVAESVAVLDTLGYRSFDDDDSDRDDGSETWVRLRRTGVVDAVRRDAGWSWTTSSGAVLQAAPGDWEVSDEQGATRSVTDSIFRATHEHLAGDRWQRVGEVRGRRARPGEVVDTLEGEVTARPDEWVLHGVEGEEWVVPQQHLDRTYERVETESQ